MIVSSAPFRVSFAGGGSDIASYYRRQAGAVLSCAIAKYSFVIVHSYFNEKKYHLKYTRTELAETLEEIAHPLLREALRMHQVEPGIEVASVADIPSGTGLGSSSSFSVALINALYAHRSRFASKDQLAEEACKLEIDILKEPMGKQDQYAAAHGGLNFIEFNSNGSVNVQPVVLSSEKDGGTREQHPVVFHRKPARYALGAVDAGAGHGGRRGKIPDRRAHGAVELRNA